MIKIAALNDESGEDSDSEEEVSKEALEQIALQQYAKALDLQRKGSLADATQLLKDLLDTELLYGVKKPAPGEKASGPLFNLKYLCYKNLASMLNSADKLDEAIEAYSAASELDDTDVSLWHRFGQVCMQAKRFEMALYAFQRGVERNPRHWPCLDKIVTLLLALDYNEQCIATIHEALKLDPGYLRGLVYRRHIYTLYKHMSEYMEYLNPIYKWKRDDDVPIDEERAKVLLKEAQVINDAYVEQQEAEKFVYTVPNVTLKKPISRLTWESVGDSLVHMHHYMTEHCFSHACFIEIKFEKEDPVVEMEVCEEKKEDVEKPEEVVADPEKAAEAPTEEENNEVSDKEKAVTDTEKVESDVETAASEAGSEAAQAAKTRKNPVRRRASDLSFLQQWEWCTKRRSGRKKTTSQKDYNIYDLLRAMVPIGLVPENHQEEKSQGKELSFDLDIDKMFEQSSENCNEEYFDTEIEQNDVKEFIKKYTENRKDIIDLLNDYLNILACKWKKKWPAGLSKIFIEANACYSTHIDIPAFVNDNKQELLHYTRVNLLVEEFLVNEKLKEESTEQASLHKLGVIDSIEIILTVNPHIFPSIECMELVLRALWLKVHIHILNKCEDFALDCLYQLQHEFDAMGEHSSNFALSNINFTFKPLICEYKISEYIKFLERNKKLSTVKDLYDRGCYEEALCIILESFDHCKVIAKDQEAEMSLDFAVQLSLILDSYWALGKVDCCLKWSFVCLNEALKHYFRYTSGTPEYEKWTLTVIKVLCCMEHIFSKEPLSCLDDITAKDLSQGLENLIRIIGHQVETNAADMPIDTVSPWIIMHYILQREDDQGRGRTMEDKVAFDDIPNPLMLLFLGHEYLGGRSWCSKSDGKLLYFVLDTVIPRLRSPSLSKSLEQIIQHLEQCVYCLFGHPNKKNRIKYLMDHSVTAHELNWGRAQQLYEIFRPDELPALEGKIPGISADTETLFHRILELLPPELDPQKYVPELEKYIKGVEDKLPSVPPLLPYKMKDIYYLLADLYFKKADRKMAVKYSLLDVIVNSDRVESWAIISLAKAANLENVLNSCKNIKNEREFLNPVKSTVRCFKRALQLDPTYMNILIEYGNFVYYVHSFCSRVLKQASESLSMEDFEALELQKEEFLNTTFKCFTTVVKDIAINGEDKTNEEAWLVHYMLGKVAEKKNKPPSVYLNCYMQSIKSLIERDATYPLKINSSSPSHLCIEVLELHYRMHASILKYIEQHENKPIPASVGKIFISCIERWQQGPFAKSKKSVPAKNETTPENCAYADDPQAVQAANILKRSISDAGEEDTHETKKLKLESAAAKIRRSASYDSERIGNKDTDRTKIVPATNATEEPPLKENIVEEKVKSDEKEVKVVEESNAEPSTSSAPETVKSKEKADDQVQEAVKNGESSSSSSSSSSSESSSSESSSDSSDSGRGSESSSKSAPQAEPLSEPEIMKIVSGCIDALEDCASRFPPHYKAIYRLAHYHFYYKSGKDVERCRDLMLSSFVMRSGQKLSGLFSERKPSNFFNNIWKIPLTEVERAGGFAFHMSRSVLLTMEILKEIDDHKTLLDLSLQLNRIPDADKKYLRDSDREELAQQAFSLCVQSLKGQVIKFSQQADLKSNNVEQEALKSLMLDIYRAWQRVQKQPNAKQFTNLLVDAYKLIAASPINENINLVDLSLKFCQSRIQALKQQATLASQSTQKKQSSKAVTPTEHTPKPVTAPAPAPPPPKIDHKVPASTAPSTGLPKMSTQDMAAAFQSYNPLLSDSLVSQQTAAALSLSYLSNISALAGYSSLQNTLQSSIQSSLQNSFQTEFFRQFLGQNYPYNMPPRKKQKRAPKATSAATSTKTTMSRPAASSSAQAKVTKSSSGTFAPVPKPVQAAQKSMSSPLGMGTVLPSLPASMTSLAPFPAHSAAPAPHMAALTSAGMPPKPPLPHQQSSPGKTLQEKLAERQKISPTVNKSSQDINASISRLPPSLTITKTSKQTQGKKPEAKKSLSFSGDVRPKPIASDEVIVLDDDD